MTLGEFRELTKDLSDDYELIDDDSQLYLLDVAIDDKDKIIYLIITEEY